MSSALNKECKGQKAQALLAILDKPTLEFEGREELQGLLSEFDPQVLARLLTNANTKALLTEWGSDPVNDNGEFVGLYHLARLPAPVVAFHAEGILKHVDDVLDGTYGWHENYPYLWEAVAEHFAAALPNVLTAFISDTMLPRLKAASADYAEQVEAAEAGGSDNHQRRPSLFQHELLDSSARLGEVARHNPAVLAAHAAELREIVLAHWEDLTREGYYEDQINELRNAVDDTLNNNTNGGGGGGGGDGDGGSADEAGE